MSAPMHVMLPLAATDRGRSGLSTYVRGLYGALLAQGQVDRLTLVATPDEAERSGLPLGDARVRVWAVPEALSGRAASVAWHFAGLPALASASRADVLHLPAGNRRPGFGGTVPTVATVHDLGDQAGARNYGTARHLYATHVVPLGLRLARRVIAISGNTQRALRDFAPALSGRTTVVPNGVDLDRFTPGDPEDARTEVRQALGADVGDALDAPYVLYASRLEHPTKNHLTLIRAFLRARADAGLPHRLLLAGAPWPGAEVILDAVAQAGDAVRYLGFLPDGVLPAVLRGAELFVFPSLFEGFGLPLLEAMACGVPVVASGAASIPEVVGDAALVVDCRDESHLAAAIVRGLEDETLRRTLRQKGRLRASRASWRVCAERTLDVFRATREET